MAFPQVKIFFDREMDFVDFSYVGWSFTVDGGAAIPVSYLDFGPPDNSVWIELFTMNALGKPASVRYERPPGAQQSAVGDFLPNFFNEGVIVAP